MITKVLVTFANTPESGMIDVVLKDNRGTIKALYADKAYDSVDIKEILEAAKVENMICLKEKKGMSDERKKVHRESEKPKHKVRAKVEHPFAVIKTQMGHEITRYSGILRNNLNYTLTALAANLKIMAHKLMKVAVSQP